jgi:hypothetical protein
MANMTDQARAFLSEAIVWVVLLGAFLVLLGVHFLDQRRRRGNRARIRRDGDWGPRAAAVEMVLAAARRLDATTAERLAQRRRAAFAWDPRLDKPPKVARDARRRAFENERDDRAMAAAEEGRARAIAALGHAAQGAAVRETAESAAETAAAIVAFDRIPGPEFRMLTKAWRDVFGQLDVRGGSSVADDPQSDARTPR